ncbi:conserved hypothetical protein [Talaromyces stipitatus ATCC 10500]|uniref:C3H1-type domain-containing protein n=1 Tax=Talaromyces stipitatus (strain ATCC 10500 / CBS 375.48 / QM 6759 / NRRL 1006) TaxID=441959 RepID=B8M053_TALSN|nr:uncharacterized protein TSTA_083820 [Talaromyces stipitatus ATCC 10500]EED21150.1 conserved hypothetical protein [Talaromyces stipitatus ATCC 10500]
MLNDIDLEKLSKDLTTITQTSKAYQNDLQNVLESFKDLLERYNSLKSDYEEEKEGRERYKRQAKARDRNPFVLVLIDGDGYMFKEHLIKAGTEGGVKAARLLSDSIKALLPPDLPDNCRIMVRIYANILGLSHTLARAQLVGQEARSYSGFTSSFTRAQDLFDFVDAGTQKEGADYKIREMFRLFADNYQCKHIFFGGCHDVGYLSMLTPYRGETNRITLLRAANMSPEYESLDLFIKELPSVFMSTVIGGSSAPPPTAPDKPVCKHFLKGICKFGAACTKSHVADGPKNKFNDDRSRPLSKESSGYFSRKQSYSKLLPKASGNTTSRIPVDKDGGRIDVYTPLPPDDLIHEQESLSPRPCNKHHLLGECNDVDCKFDHGYVEPELVDVMRWQAKRRQCLRGRGCRVLKCPYGHHCQIDGCAGEKPCKMGHRFHNFSPHVARWVEADDLRDSEEVQPSIEGDRDDQADARSSRSLSVATTSHTGTLSKVLIGEESPSISPVVI